MWAKSLEENMKKWLIIMMLVVVASCSLAIYHDDEIANSINHKLVEKVLINLNQDWVEYDYPNYDYLTPCFEVRTSIAKNFLIGGEGYYRVYKSVYERLRKYFSNPKVLWSTYFLLKPVIVEQIQQRPEVTSKLKRIFDEEFIRHLEGESEYSHYLIKRWELKKAINDNKRKKVSKERAQEIRSNNQKIEKIIINQESWFNEEALYEYSLKSQDFYLVLIEDNDGTYRAETLAHAEAVARLNVLQSDLNASYWGYAYGISERLGYAFDFRMRRISEGGEELADTWAKVVRDLIEEL